MLKAQNKAQKNIVAKMGKRMKGTNSHFFYINETLKDLGEAESSKWMRFF